MLTDVISRLTTPARADDTVMSFGPRRGVFINAADRVAEDGEPLDDAALAIHVLNTSLKLCTISFNRPP
jgi:hypothetical protein